jgi:Domain of unknown function (DUF4397)
MKTRSLLIIAAFPVLFGACTQGNTGNPGDPVTKTKSSVRAIHASVDTPAVDVLVDGTKAGGPLEFKSAFPGLNNQYASLDSGSRNLKVCAAPADTTCPINATLTLVADTKYSVIALGTIATTDDSGTDARPLEPLVLTDTEAVPAAGKTKVRFVHAASLVAAKTVDVYVTAPDATLTSATTATKANFNYKDNSGYIEVPTGSYRVRITAPGSKTALIDTGTTGVSLADGKLYTAIAVNPTGTVGVVLLNDN